MHEYLTVWQVFQAELQVENIELRLIPKHIWMFHYGRLSQICGSMVHLNTQFGEQKNAAIKSHSQKANQTKNVLLTIAKTEVVLSALANQKDKNLRPINNLRAIAFDKLSEDLRNIVLGHCYTRSLDVSDLAFYKSVHLFGFTFRADQNSCICFNDPRHPTFGLLHAIAKISGSEKLFFIVENLKKSLDTNFDLYSLERVATYVWVEASELVLGRPLNVYPMTNYLNEDKLYCENFFC